MDYKMQDPPDKLKQLMAIEFYPIGIISLKYKLETRSIKCARSYKPLK
jgi:hypothetical protein